MPFFGPSSRTGAADVGGRAESKSATEASPRIPARDTTLQTGDTGAAKMQRGETGVDIAAVPAATDAARSTLVGPTTQWSPSNLNVGIRIASPGDGGAVMQVNLAEIGGAGAPAAGPPPAGGPRVAAAVLPTGSLDDTPGGWLWQWDCVSLPDFTAISPGGSVIASIPRNWTWIWNCGDNPGQYQGGTPVQYRPSNVNVSIRVASPGNDGPVVQSNVGVAVAANGRSLFLHASTAVATVPWTAAGAVSPLASPLPDLPPLPLPDAAVLFSTAAPATQPIGEDVLIAGAGPELPAAIEAWLEVPLALPVTFGASRAALPSMLSPGRRRGSRWWGRSGATASRPGLALARAKGALAGHASLSGEEPVRPRAHPLEVRLGARP